MPTKKRASEFFTKSQERAKDEQTQLFQPWDTEHRMFFLAKDLVRRLANLPGRGSRSEVARPSVVDDLSIMRCLKPAEPETAETFLYRSAEDDCAEFIAPDGRLIWEAASHGDD